MEKEEYFKTEDDVIYKTVEYEDGSMMPFVFQLKSNEWINVPVGHLAQAQWNGIRVEKAEAEKIMELQKRKAV